MWCVYLLVATTLFKQFLKNVFIKLSFLAMIEHLIEWQLFKNLLPT